MDALITVVQGDYGYDITFTLKDANGSLVDLTGSVVTFICQSVSDDSVQFTGPMTVLIAANGYCKYSPVATDFATPGSYTAQVSVNYGSLTEVVTFSGMKINVVSKLPVT